MLQIELTSVGALSMNFTLDVKCTIPGTIFGDHDHAIAIKNQSYLLRMSSKILNIAEVAISNIFPSLILFLLYHVRKPSTIHHQTRAGLVIKINWISQSI